MDTKTLVEWLRRNQAPERTTDVVEPEVDPVTSSDMTQLEEALIDGY